jgi:SAM-dependent methyltransferase
MTIPPTDSSPTRRFSDRVDHYARYRPSYPPVVIDLLRERIGLSRSWVVADIGSGTGISTELFLRHGHVVHAVEPNDAMRRSGEARLREFENFRSVGATAEATTLPDVSIDLIVAAQAFHWFDRDAFGRECRRIIRPGGWVLLMWNDRDLTSTPFLRAYESLLNTFGTDYQRVNHRRIEPSDLRAFFGGDFQRIDLPHAQTFDFDGLRGRLLSSSYVPGQSDPRHEPMLGALREIFETHHVDRQVQMQYQTQLYLAHLSGS